MTKKLYFSSVLCLVTLIIHSQNNSTRNLGNAKHYANLINNVVTMSSTTSVFNLPTPSGASIVGKVNYKKSMNGIEKIIGNGVDATSMFSLSVNKYGTIEGLYTSTKERKAYSYYTDDASNDLMVKEVAIESVLCIDYKQAPDEPSPKKGVMSPSAVTAVPLFESKPGSEFVIYIDLDGEVSTSDWAGGATINAAARSWSTADMQTIWEIVAQDYITFDVNVTTDRAVFDAANIKKRKMCIVTSTNTASPGAGGVAYIGSFSDGKDNPCWAFNNGAKTCGETVSHEIGHTVGLHHDGNANTTYYSGHADWAPIMGSSYSRAVGHWSLGEYTNANNQEDDINIIGTKNGFAPNPDDIGNTTSTAKILIVEGSGSVLDVSNRGVINNRLDKDVFKFTTVNSGDINLTIKPFYKYPNLNVKARLLDVNGVELSNGDPSNSMSATVTANGVSAGTYYLEIDGVGNGADPSVGYSDYCSIGDYYITGSVPLPSKSPFADFSSNSSKPCPGTQVAYNDESLNGAISWNWSFPGGSPASSTSKNPVVTYNNSGSFDVKLVVQNSFGKDSVLRVSYIQVSSSPTPPTTVNADRCSPGVVNLSASGSGETLAWYDAPTGGTLVTTGNTFSPNLTTSTTYYVEEAGTTTLQKVGAVDNSLNSGSYFTNNDLRGLIFDVYEPCTLKSVKVYANSAGNRTIEVLESVEGNVLHSKVVNIPAGESRITLDFNLQPGTQYHIKVTGALVDLYRNSSGANYPYTLQGLVSITETNAGSPNYYYYFYDWEVGVQGCPSLRSPVTGNIYQLNQPTITQSSNVLTSSATSGNQWYLDGILIPGATGQSYTVQAAGDYTVLVTAGGCASPASNPVTITTVGIFNATENTYFAIYPNPNDGNFNIAFNVTPKENYRIELKNALGQLIYSELLTNFSGSYSKQLNINQHRKGVYMISLIPMSDEAKNEIVKKVIVY